MGLLRYLRPDMVVERVWELDPARLREAGIRALLLDLDNTLTEWRSRTIDEATRAWIGRAKESGLRLCICSNSSRPRRVREIAEALDISYLPFATKPSRRSVFRALALVEARPEEAAVVGDQIFTDVLAGKLSGARSIWVRPLSPHEFVFTRVVRWVEGLVMRALRKRGLWPGAEAGVQAEGGAGADTR